MDQEAYPYSASIFDVEEKTGNVVTRVNLNEEPNLKFSVSMHTHSLTHRALLIHDVHYVVCQWFLTHKGHIMSRRGCEKISWGVNKKKQILLCEIMLIFVTFQIFLRMALSVY